MYLVWIWVFTILTVTDKDNIEISYNRFLNSILTGWDGWWLQKENRPNDPEVQWLSWRKEVLCWGKGQSIFSFIILGIAFLSPNSESSSGTQHSP